MLNGTIQAWQIVSTFLEKLSVWSQKFTVSLSRALGLGKAEVSTSDMTQDPGVFQRVECGCQRQWEILLLIVSPGDTHTAVAYVMGYSRDTVGLSVFYLLGS